MRFDNLPHNAKLSILLHLDYKGIMRMMVLSKSWHGLLSQNQEFWRQKFELDFGDGSWEGGEVDFEEEYKIEYGWRFKRPKIVELGGHEDMIKSVHINGSNLLSCSSDGIARMWDLERMAFLWEFREEKRIYSVALHGENVFVGLQDGAIHVWNVNSRQLRHSWQADRGRIAALCLADGHLISGGMYSIKLWDLNTFECRQCFEVEGFKWIHVDGKEIICGLAREKGVAVFHEDDGLLYTLDVEQIVYSVCASSRHIFVGCANEHVQVWERTSKERVAILVGGAIYIRRVWCDARKLISVSSSGRMKIWDSTNFSLLREVNVAIGQVCRVDYDKGRVVVGSGCGRIQVLSFAL